MKLQHFIANTQLYDEALEQAMAAGSVDQRSIAILERAAQRAAQLQQPVSSDRDLQPFAELFYEEVVGIDGYQFIAFDG